MSCCEICEYLYCSSDKEPCKSCRKYVNFKEKEVNVIEKTCGNCEFKYCLASVQPCRSCMTSDKPYSGFVPRESLIEPIEPDIVISKDKSGDFGPNMMRQEEFKIPDDILVMIDQNKKPSLVIPQLDGIKEDIKTYHDDTEKYLTSFSNWLVRIETKVNTIKSHQINLEKANHAIEDKIDKLTESLESVNSKLDILDQRMHDLRQHQILKDMKCVTQVKEPEKDISRPEPKFKVGDIVKATNDIKKRDFFIHKVKWSSRNMSWIYLISHDSEDISGAYWRNETWLVNSKDADLTKFHVGDKVKRKHGEIVYTVKSFRIGYSKGNEYVYENYYELHREGHKSQYEYESNLIKA